MITILVDERTKAGRTLLETARIMAKHDKGIDIGDDKKSKVKGMEAVASKRKLKLERDLIQGLKEAKEISQGKRKHKTLEQLLNEE